MSWRSTKISFFCWNIKLFPCLLYSLYSAGVLSSNAQTPIVFDNLTLEDGLSQCTVTSIIQDETGYMWFSTFDGLNKLDGNSFTVYRANETDRTTISDDWITSLYIDKRGTLWIGTLKGGLNRYNRKTDDFTRYPLELFLNYSTFLKNALAQLPSTYSFFNDNSIKSIFEDSDSTLWIGTFGNGLFRFNRKEETFSHRPYDFLDRSGLAYLVMDITETIHATGAILWVATFGGGLLRFEKNKDFTVYRHNPADRYSLSNNNIMSICPDTSAGNPCLWIATLGGGLNKFDILNETFTHFRYQPHNENSISSDRLLSILKDDHNELWVGTFGSGLDQIKLDKLQFTNYTHDPSNMNGLNSNDVYAIYKDRSGILWIGTNLGNGVNKLDRTKYKFRHYYHNPTDPASLSDNVILTIYKDTKDFLWIGTMKNGLNKFDRLHNKFIHFKHNPNDPYSISDNHIRALHEDRNGFLWIGTFSNGLDMYDPESETFTHFKFDPANPYSISANQVRTIYEDRDSMLWIGTFGGGLNRLDRRTGRFYYYQHNPDDPNSLCDDRIYSICQDDSGFLWISTFYGGFDIFDTKKNNFIHHQHDPYNPNSLSDNLVLGITFDPYREHIVWLGTFGGGLNKYNRSTRTFVNYTEKDGLPNNVIYGILIDERGFLWLSTNNGISKFDPETEAFINYGVKDGLQGNEFNANAFFRCPRTGEMFFGGLNGFNCFFPDHVNTNPNIPPIVLTSLKIFGNETSHLFGPVNELDEIHLSHKDKYISFEFSALDYTNFKKNQFTYKLDGLNNDWIKAGNRRYVTFTNLDPGEYTFRVKGCNSDGVWNEQGKSIKLIIDPPFWKRWWFYLITLSSLITAVAVLNRYQVRIKIKRSLEMEHIRIAENEQVRKSVAADFHDELGQKLTRISLFSEILKRKLAPGSQDDINYVDKINNAAKELSLSTRDFIWTINPAQDSLYDVAIYLKDFGDEMFDKTGINFRVNEISRDFENIKLPMEWRRHITLIFKEAMNNALKHAACKNVTFNIELNARKLEIKLTDDGKGYQPKPNSSGLGLANMHNRAKRIQCSLHILSDNQNQGTTVQLLGDIPQMGY